MNEELIHNSVMSEKMVQNSVMNEEFVKNFVMKSKIDPKVVMGLSMFKLGGTSRRTCIVERTYDEEIHKRINHILCERTCVQIECSEDAIRIE